MIDETERWAFGLVGLGFITLVGWFISHGAECKRWRETVMEKLGKLEGRNES